MIILKLRTRAGITLALVAGVVFAGLAEEAFASESNSVVFPGRPEVADPDPYETSELDPEMFLPSDALPLDLKIRSYKR